MGPRDPGQEPQLPPVPQPRRSASHPPLKYPAGVLTRGPEACAHPALATGKQAHSQRGTSLRTHRLPDTTQTASKSLKETDRASKHSQQKLPESPGGACYPVLRGRLVR